MPFFDCFNIWTELKADVEHRASPRQRLATLAQVASNPGSLTARTYIPEALASGAALVVVLHGAGQTAVDYDDGAGWSRLADQLKFAVLFPEQSRSNNAARCFNWFESGDNQRDGGEALSIRQMVEQVVIEHEIDPGRVFVTGLSSGGAMASVMLATYPDVFAGGAIIAGLAYGCADNVPQALQRMLGYGCPTSPELNALVVAASPDGQTWPTVSVWHGSGDNTVAPSNAVAIIEQWSALHAVGSPPTRSDLVDGYPHRVWCGSDGRALIEEYSITGMGHGAPLDPDGVDGCGVSGAYMLDVGINSTRRIAEAWGLSRPARTVRAPRGGKRSPRRPSLRRPSAADEALAAEAV